MHRTICDKLWTDEKIKKLAPLDKLLFLYLITNPFSHLCGLYWLPEATMISQLGFTPNWEAIKDHAIYDPKFEQVFVFNMLRYQGRGPKAKVAAIRQLESLHSSPITCTFYQFHKRLIKQCRGIRYRYPTDTPPLPLPIPESVISSSGSGSKSGSGATTAPTKTPKKFRQPFPDDFKPDDRGKQLAESYRLNPFAEAAACLDHHGSLGNTFVDHQKAFRNWLRKAKLFRERSNGHA